MRKIRRKKTTKAKKKKEKGKEKRRCIHCEGMEEGVICRKEVKIT